MKSIRELATRELVERQQESITKTQAGTLRSPELPEEAKDYINKIFYRMTVITPAWKNSVDGDPTEWAGRYKSELAASLKDEGVTTGEQIKEGLASLRRTGSPFLPSPGLFARYCTGKDENREHTGKAYKLSEFDTYGQKRICHKRSVEDNQKGLSQIKSIRSFL